MFQFRRFPAYTYFVQCTLTEYCSAGFPHSEILGSKLMCSSPRLIAACHVLLRLLMPRHSPCALISLTFRHTKCALVDSIYFGSQLRIMQASVWFHCSFVTLNSYIKSPQKFVLCYLSVACSQFLACFHCSVFKVQFVRPFSRPDKSIPLLQNTFIRT